MKSYYLSEKNEKWKGPFLREEILLKIINDEINPLSLVWFSEICPNKADTPNKCNHTDLSKRITEIIAEILVLPDKGKITKIQFENLLSFDFGKKSLEEVDSRLFSLAVKNKKCFTEFVNHNNLNKFDISLIGCYTDLVFRDLNNSLRKINTQNEEKYTYYKTLLNEALESIKSGYCGQKVFAMGNDNQNEKLDWFNTRIGKIVEFPNFLSTSINRWKDHDFAFEINTSEESLSKYIAPLSNKKALEEEVLFPTNCRFEITGVDLQKRHVQLKEIKMSRNTDYILKECFTLNYEN